MKAQIQALFHVPEIKNHEKYLGLPSFVGRSKVAAFGELKSRGVAKNLWVEGKTPL